MRFFISLAGKFELIRPTVVAASITASVERGNAKLIDPFTARRRPSPAKSAQMALMEPLVVSSEKEPLRLVSERLAEVLGLGDPSRHQHQGIAKQSQKEQRRNRSGGHNHSFVCSSTQETRQKLATILKVPYFSQSLWL
jgi:hypothetical protein